MTEAKLRNKVKILEQDLASKTEALHKYQAMGSAADQKIQALSKIHNDKIRSLMNSIQMLKKDNAQLLNQGKEHKRSKLIAELNKQIMDQDIVIEVIRNYVYKKEGREEGRAGLDGIIVAALTKGPERIRAETREELKIEIENLKARVNQMKSGNAKVVLKEQREVLENSSELSSATIENDREELFKTLHSTKTANEKLSLELKSSMKTIESLKAQLAENGKLEVDVMSLNSELLIASKKIETLESLLKQTKQYNNNKIMELYQREIKVQELELESRNNNTKLNQIKQSHNLALQQLSLQNQRLKEEIESITKENERMILENMGMKKTHDTQRGKIEEIREMNNKQKHELGDKLQKYEKEFERLVNDNNEKNQSIVNLKQGLKKEKAEVLRLKLKLEEIEEKGVSTEEVEQLVQKIQDLEEELGNWKESGGEGGSVPSSLLLDRIKTLDKRIHTLQKQLNDGRILTDKETEALHDQNLFDKYIQLAREFETFKIKNKSSKPKKDVQHIYLDEEERERLEKIDTSIEDMGLKSVGSNTIKKFDSDFEYQIHEIKRNKPGLPVISEYDRELMKLITSDLWDFLEDDNVGRMLENLSNYDSDYPSENQEEDYDEDWNSNFKALQDIGKRMKKGDKIRVYAEEFNEIKEMNSDVSEVLSMRDKDLEKAYDSDIQLDTKRIKVSTITDRNKPSLLLNSKDLGRVENISSSLSNSIMEEVVSQPESGQSNINLFKKREPSKDKRRMKEKSSMLIGNLDGKYQQINSDYEEPNMVRRKLGLNGSMNSSVSGGSGVNDAALKLISSDLSVGSFKKK